MADKEKSTNLWSVYYLTSDKLSGKGKGAIKNFIAFSLLDCLAV